LNLLVSSNGNNHAQWLNETYDTMLLNIEDPKISFDRKKILSEAEQLIIDEMPIIPLWFESICHLVSERVEGWYPNILDWHLLKFVHFISVVDLMRKNVVD
jgi:oligopeptide transport system substrate-binding protein